jgi:DNA polymerase-1
LAAQHELPAQILHYRSLSKLKSTYVDALPALVNPATGRLHTSLNQTVVATGRLSSAEPNLQNIPIKGEHGFRIREAFVASPGHMLLCADYSQIEPRILAHLSGDEKLKKVFERGEDIHTATAVELFKLSPDSITREMRRIAKTVVFGIVYGISPFGLSQNIGVSQAEAKKYIETYFERYAGVKAFIDRTIAEAKERGYTMTIAGRRRPIPELQSSDPAQRSYGERQAVNSPIQGSAADAIKVAMIAVHKKLRAELPSTKMILQVHDELIFETPVRDVEPAKTLIRAEMEAVGPRLGLSVPLKVEVGTGRNWREAHP